jgi:tRNA pseudouridine38-40 synthase
MVRSLVGTMVDVARGYRTVDEFRPILAGMDRRLAGPTAPPQGLFLERVHY